MRPTGLPAHTAWVTGRLVATVSALVGLFALPLPTGAVPIEARQTVRIQSQDASATMGTVVGTAWKADNTPLAAARLRLRDVTTGRAVARTAADAKGEFRFDQVETGAYVVELLSDRDSVLAIGELFGLRPGDTVTTFVRLSARAPWGQAFFRNAAAAAIAAASTIGITAIGSSGLPASPQ